ncbi:MAG TPA: hypothetical protein VMT68_02980 [Caulobacteraceae bacterium]|nr:hypothetical protein [Caulobacteraceae bacterium]
MTNAQTARPGAITHERAPVTRYGVFAVTFGVIFAVAYLLVMSKGWQLFTYYPLTGEWTPLSQSATGPSAGPAMKWYGYVATSALVACATGLLVCLLPQKPLTRLWWAGLIWLVPMLAMMAVAYLIVVVGD